MSKRAAALSLSDGGDAPTKLTAIVPIGRGMVLAGKYEVDRVLGEGGMGVVVAAKHLQLDQLVALKFLLPDVSKDPETVERFLREAQSASQIRSEHVARVLDVGTLDSGAPFMVMELLVGRDLGALLNETGVLPPQQAVDFVLQGMEAIAEAHALGIIHRDIKPSNLFLTHRADGAPFVKVLDFGLSKNVAADRNQKALTRTSTGAMGSPLYMAPEQVRSAKSASYASDVWSLGVMLYELLTDQVPFDGESIGALLAAIVADDPRPLRAAAPHLPEGLEKAVMRCLVKDPAGRHPDLGALARALAPFASARGQVSVQRIVGALAAGPSAEPTGHAAGNGPDRAAQARTGQELSAAPDRPLRRGAALLAALLAAGGLVGIGSYVLLRAQQGAAGDGPPSSAADEAAPREHRVTSDLPTIVPVPPETAAPGPIAASAEPSASAAPGSPSSSAAPAASSASPRGSARPPRPRPPRPKPPSTSKSIDDLLKQGRH